MVSGPGTSHSYEININQNKVAFYYLTPVLKSKGLYISVMVKLITSSTD